MEDLVCQLKVHVAFKEADPEAEPGHVYQGRVATCCSCILKLHLYNITSQQENDLEVRTSEFIPWESFLSPYTHSRCHLVIVKTSSTTTGTFPSSHLGAQRQVIRPNVIGQFDPL